LISCSIFEDADPKIAATLAEIRQSPPNEDILIKLLDAEVTIGKICEMTAMMELDDFRDEEE